MTDPKPTSSEKQRALEWARKWHSTTLARVLLAQHQELEVARERIRQLRTHLDCAEEETADAGLRHYLAGAREQDDALASGETEKPMRTPIKKSPPIADPRSRIDRDTPPTRYVPKVGDRVRCTGSPEPDDAQFVGKVGELLAPCGIIGWWVRFDGARVNELLHRDATFEPVEAQPSPPVSEPGEGPWRTGRKLGRTVYYDDVLVGVFDQAAVAKRAVDALNAATWTTKSPVSEPGEVSDAIGDAPYGVWGEAFGRWVSKRRADDPDNRPQPTEYFQGGFNFGHQSRDAEVTELKRFADEAYQRGRTDERGKLGGYIRAAQDAHETLTSERAAHAAEVAQWKGWLDEVTAALHGWHPIERRTYVPDQLADRARDLTTEVERLRKELEEADEWRIRCMKLDSKLAEARQSRPLPDDETLALRIAHTVGTVPEDWGFESLSNEGRAYWLSLARAARKALLQAPPVEPDNTPPDPLPEVLPKGTPWRADNGRVGFFTEAATLRGDDYIGRYECSWMYTHDTRGHIPTTAIDWAHYRSQQSKDSGSPGSAVRDVGASQSAGSSPAEAAQPGDASRPRVGARVVLDATPFGFSAEEPGFYAGYYGGSPRLMRFHIDRAGHADYFYDPDAPGTQGGIKAWRPASPAQPPEQSERERLTEAGPFEGMPEPWRTKLESLDKRVAALAGRNFQTENKLRGAEAYAKELGKQFDELRSSVGDELSRVEARVVKLERAAGTT